jgi:hypothetical protein
MGLLSELCLVPPSGCREGTTSSQVIATHSQEILETSPRPALENSPKMSTNDGVALGACRKKSHIAPSHPSRNCQYPWRSRSIDAPQVAFGLSHALSDQRSHPRTWLSPAASGGFLCGYWPKAPNIGSLRSDKFSRSRLGGRDIGGENIGVKRPSLDSRIQSLGCLAGKAPPMSARRDSLEVVHPACSGKA